MRVIEIGNVPDDPAPPRLLPFLLVRTTGVRTARLSVHTCGHARRAQPADCLDNGEIMWDTPFQPAIIAMLVV
ncbi:MAG: hypothetical protein ABWZ98_07705, partial [Nakamurella sp.]